MSCVSELEVGWRFTPHEVPGYKQASFLVVEIGPARSVGKEGHRRIVVRSKSGRSSKTKILTLPDDMQVTVSDHGKPPDEPKKSCRCRNHMGTRKHLHKTRDAALAAILHHHLRHGGHSIYPCPSGLGFHVRSQKMKVDIRSS